MAMRRGMAERDRRIGRNSILPGERDQAGPFSPAAMPRSILDQRPAGTDFPNQHAGLLGERGHPRGSLAGRDEHGPFVDHHRHRASIPPPQPFGGTDKRYGTAEHDEPATPHSARNRETSPSERPHDEADQPQFVRSER